MGKAHARIATGEVEDGRQRLMPAVNSVGPSNNRSYSDVVMTTNPYSAGGGGAHLEARVVASCLAAVWCEAPVRGLLGYYATEVRTQGAAFGDPLDDIVVYGLRDDGRATQLHLQIKNKLTFTANDEEWADVVARAWTTFTKEGFDITKQRLGVGIGTYHARRPTLPVGVELGRVQHRCRAFL